MDREAWRPFLKRWSEEWITAHDPERDRPLDDEVVRDAWLGFAPASADEVAAAEARLGRSLPPSLREFLLVTNGWRDAGNFIYRLAGTTELDWLRDTDDAGWIEAYSELDDGGVLGRSLRLSLAGDAAALLLDPDDVDDNGEWAGYWLASWSGMGPERHGSFYDLMYHLYASFHDLCRPEGQTRERWDAEVEQARLAALTGEIDEPLAVLEQAQAFGRDRARLLRFQLLAMLGDWYTLPLSHVVLIQDRAGLLRDPLFTAELLPLLLAEDRLTHRHDRFTLEHLLRTDRQAVQPLIAEYQARRRDPGFRLRFGNPEFDAAVHRIVDPLTAHPAFQVPDPFTAKRSPPGLVRVSTGRPHPAGIVGVARAEEIRRRLTGAAWPGLRQAIRLWRPVSEDHIAPVVLFADPVLAEMLTPERGREILSMRRGDPHQAKAVGDALCAGPEEPRRGEDRPEGRWMVPPQPGDSGMTPADQADVQQFVERYVHQLKTEGAIRSPAVERAFRTVERHRLLEIFYHRPVEAPDFAMVHHDPEHPHPEHLKLIYGDTALATRVVDGMPASSTSQPSLVAQMLELLDLTPGLRVLEIGAGTGYNAALMAELVGDQHLVVTVDVLDDVVAQTRRLLALAGYPGIGVLLRDGIQGAPERAPFDRIVATVGCSDLSPRWAEQLADGGVLLVPLAHAGGHPLYLLRKQHGRLEGQVVSWAGFMAVRGPLHLDGLWPRGILLPAADEPIHQRDPWPGFGTDEVDFCFYLSLLDRRACWAPDGVGLSDGLSGWAVAGPGGIRWWKSAALVEQLDRLHAGWLARGRPMLGDYRVAFVPIERDATPPPGGFALDRRFFREFAWLGKP